jgi:C4-type Zn-finger protein
MSENVYQLTQLACTMCGQGNIQPQTSTYHDRYAQETVTEATWVCHRCGNRFNSGIVSRQPDEKTKKDN